MIDLGYEFLLEVYNEAMDFNGVFYTISGLKLFAVSFLMIHYYIRFIKSAHTQPGEGKAVMPLTPYDFYVGIAYVVAIVGFDYVLYFLDFVFTPLSDFTMLKPSVIPPPDPGVEPINNPVVDEGPVATLKVILSYMLKFANPMSWIFTAFTTIGFLIDQFIFGFFLLQRFFIMGVLRIIGPIALLLAIFPQTKHYFTKWISVYIAQYILVIPYLAITGFVNILYRAMNEGFVGELIPMLSGLVIIFVIFLKISLFITSKRMVSNIFS